MSLEVRVGKSIAGALLGVLWAACLTDHLRADSDAIGDGSQILKINSTLADYLKSLESSGVPVIVDCYEGDKILENIDTKSKTSANEFFTSFYRIFFADGGCYVYPKDNKNKSDFLNHKIDSLVLGKAPLDQILKQISKECGMSLNTIDTKVLYKEKHPQIVQFKNITVGEALLRIAKICGSNRVSLSAILDENNQRIKSDSMIITF